MIEVIEKSMCISRQHTHGIHLGNISGCNSHLADERALQYIDEKHFISPQRTAVTKPAILRKGVRIYTQDNLIEIIEVK